MMSYSKYQKLRCYQKYLCMNFKRKKRKNLLVSKDRMLLRIRIRT